MSIINSMTITFNGGLIVGDTVRFYYYPSYPSVATSSLRGETAVATRAFPGQVSTGATANAQATNYYDAFVLDYGASFTVSLLANVVTITALNGSPLFSATSSSSNVAFEISNVYDYVEDIRVRSPYLLISTGTTATTFTESVFTIKQFEGNVNDFSIAPISYVKTKQKIVPTQDNIWINISNLVKEDLEANIDYYQDADYTTARNLSLNESKWVYISTVNQYLASGVTTGNTIYFIVDGYIEPTETQGLSNLLLTGDKRYIYRGSNERLYFKTKNLTGATYSTPTTGPTAISYTGDTDFNYGYVKSIKIDTPLTEDRITYTFNYSGTTPQTVTYNLYDECKYETYDLVFKNKYGMMETLSMSKKSSKVLNIESTDYLRSIVNLEGSYNINRHTNKQFNVAGMEEWTLNTQLLPEYMNAPIKEAMLTEEMWLIDSSGLVIPVIKVDSSIAFKTSLNDKMIQYTVKVKLSHNTIQNIL